MKKWIVWAALLLLILNIAAISTILYNRKQENLAGELPQQRFASDSLAMRYSGRWFRDELGLTNEQMKEFQRFNPFFRQKLRSINFELAEKRRLMLEEMTAENVDTARLNILSDSIGMLHSDLKKATYSYYLEFKSISTPEQQEKLRQVFSRMFEGEIPAGPGRGMQGRGRFGMRRGQNQDQ